MRTFTIVSLFVMIVLLCSFGMSQTAATEPFFYPVTISGLGSTGNGFSGSWVIDTAAHGAEGKAALVGNAFDYSDLTYAMSDTGGQIQVNLVNAWSDAQRYARALSSTWANTAGQHYWFSYLLDVKTVPQNNTYFMVKLYYATNIQDGTGEIVAVGKSGGQNSPVFSCGSGWTGAAPDVSTIPIAVGPVWLVARFDMNGGTADCRTFMWVSPNPATEPDTSTAAVKRYTGMPHGFNAVKLEYGGDVAAGTPITLVFDAIRIATSYAQLATVTSVKPLDNQPNQFSLNQNYPNPFNPTTTINYTLKTTGMTRLTVYDVLGREVAVLVNGTQSQGSHTATFQADRLASGIYFYRLESSGSTMTKKMLLLK